MATVQNIKYRAAALSTGEAALLATVDRAINEDGWDETSQIDYGYSNADEILAGCETGPEDTLKDITSSITEDFEADWDGENPGRDNKYRALTTAQLAARAVALRDLIGHPDFPDVTQARYDHATRAWRTIIGPVHPDDEQFPAHWNKRPLSAATVKHIEDIAGPKVAADVGVAGVGAYLTRRKEKDPTFNEHALNSTGRKEFFAAYYAHRDAVHS